MCERIFRISSEGSDSISDWSLSDRKEENCDWSKEREVSDWLKRGDEIEDRSNLFQSVDWRTNLGDSDWSRESSNGRAVCIGVGRAANFSKSEIFFGLGFFS